MPLVMNTIGKEVNSVKVAIMIAGHTHTHTRLAVVRCSHSLPGGRGRHYCAGSLSSTVGRRQQPRLAWQDASVGPPTHTQARATAA